MHIELQCSIIPLCTNCKLFCPVNLKILFNHHLLIKSLAPHLFCVFFGHNLNITLSTLKMKG